DIVIGLELGRSLVPDLHVAGGESQHERLPYRPEQNRPGDFRHIVTPSLKWLASGGRWPAGASAQAVQSLLRDSRGDGTTLPRKRVAGWNLAGYAEHRYP